jgi:hypothetical protein
MVGTSMAYFPLATATATSLIIRLRAAPSIIRLCCGKGVEPASPVRPPADLRVTLVAVLPGCLLAAYRTEGFRLAATSRSVELVEQALRGEAFNPRF